MPKDHPSRSTSVVVESLDAPRPGPSVPPAFVDLVPEALLLVCTEGSIVRANPRALALLGRAGGAAAGASIFDIAPALSEQRWTGLRTGAGDYRSECMFRRPDGSDFLAAFTVSELNVDGDRCLCLCIRDITTQRRTEEQLSNVEERFEQLVEGSLQGISVDAYDNQPLFVNQAFAELYGYDSPAEIFELDTLQDLVAPEDRERLETYTRSRRVDRASAPSVYDFQAIKKDGTRITVLCSAQPVVWEGVPAVQATLLDITDRQRIEDAERDREAARARLVGAMEASSEGFALFDADDRLYYSNQRYRQMLCGIEEILIPGTSFREIIQRSVECGAIPDAGADSEAWLEMRMQRHRLSQGVEHYRADSGMWLRVREQRLEHGDIFVVASDITHIKESQRELADKTLQLQTAYENMEQGIVMLDDQYRIVVFNQRLLETSSLPDLDMKPGMLIVDVWRKLAERGLYGEGDVDELVARRLQMVTDGKPYRFVVEQLNGRFLEVRGRPTGDGGHVITHTDITETHRLSRKLTYQANHDALTGLANRQRFESALESLLDDARRGNTHALCYLDLDQFKVINDTCGHLAGDELLRQLGGILPEQVRQGDLLARLGGDEFGMLLENCAVEPATRIAEKVRDAVDAFRFVWQGRMFRIGTSIGVVPIDRASQSVSDILSNADTACYAAKDEGGNRVHVYHPNDTELARRRGDMQWVADINRSLEQNDLVLYKQPIVSLDSAGDGKQRYEVLLRLRDTDGNIFEPRSFMRSAERFGLMGKLDQWVVDTMLDWLNVQDGKGAGAATYFINISGISLRDGAFRGCLIERLQDCRWSGLRVCLEVTETAAVASLANAAEFMERIGALGHSCALDDFGSGLSSFAYLRNLPVEYLKIDGQFVRDMDDDPIDLAMVKSITEVAQVMGKLTIAEFAETSRVLDRLREIGVDYAQGYAVGRPGPLDGSGNV